MELSLRAYQARTRLPVTGRLDLETLAALALVAGATPAVLQSLPPAVCVRLLGRRFVVNGSPTSVGLDCRNALTAVRRKLCPRKFGLRREG